MDDPSAGPPALRPQTLMFTFLGNYVLGRDVCVFSGSYIEAMSRLGVSEHATRSTLARMVNRGLLRRSRSGRRMYFGLTSRSEAILRDGERRVWRADAVSADPGTSWTLVGFSLPEPARRTRHELRSRLMWAGFGMLHSGLWIAPSRVDVAGILAELGLDGHVKVFTAQPVHPADLGPVIRDAYDLADVAGRYRRLLDRWDRPDPLPEVPDPLARKLLLLSEWLEIVRRDPRLPRRYLPADWPAVRAQRVMRAAHDRLDAPAARTAAGLLDTVPDLPAGEREETA